MVNRKYNSVALLLIWFVLVVASTKLLYSIINNDDPSTGLCPKAILARQDISCGENKLVPKPYPKNDPEYLIYTNNQGMGKVEYYTIAVAAPLNTGKEDGDNIGLEILRGVAQAQNEVNNNGGINGKMLRVAIADDGGNVNRAKNLANILGNQNDILAVVGHYSSKVTKGVVDVYQKNKLVLISPSSTLVKLAKAGDFFFRTVPSNRVMAVALVQHMVNQVGKEKAAVFYNPDSPYSTDLLKQFIASGGKVEKTFDLSEFSFNANSAVAEAVTLGVEMLVLFPDVNNRENARKVIKANQNRYCMMGGATLYNYETLQEVGTEAEKKLVAGTHWHIGDSPNQEFPRKAEELWKGQVSWRTALAYDATRALITALANKPQADRSSVQQALADPEFEASGATGKISFQRNGDRNEQIQELTTVVAKDDGGYKFVLIEPKSLDCDRP